MSPIPSYRGHVEDGVVIFDSEGLPAEGQKVNVQPIETASDRPLESEQADRLREMERHFAEWTEEDGKLSDEEADVLENALRRSRGLEFRSPMPD